MIYRCPFCHRESSDYGIALKHEQQCVSFHEKPESVQGLWITGYCGGHLVRPHYDMARQEMRAFHREPIYVKTAGRSHI